MYFQTSDIFRNLTFSFSTPDPPTSLSFPWLFNRVKADFADSSNLVKKSNLESKRYFVICEKEIVNQNFKMYFLDTFFQTWLLSWGQISIFWRRITIISDFKIPLACLKISISCLKICLSTLKISICSLKKLVFGYSIFTPMNATGGHQIFKQY